MRKTTTAYAAGTFAAFLLTSVPGWGVTYPFRELKSASTGLMESKISGEWYRGSGVIARDPRLIYSCAHLFYEQGRWATDYRFHRAYHDRFDPRTLQGASPRGFYYFTSYSSSVARRGSNSAAAFASDFTVFYGDTSFGPAVGWWPEGGPALRSSRLKSIVGYPATIEYTGRSGFSYQHTTGYFSQAAYRELSGYHLFSGVSTGPGNSGGPVFVREKASGNDFLAGILVSGSRRSAGVVALDSSTHSMASQALGLTPLSRAFSDTTQRQLQDGSTTFTVIPFVVSGFSGTVSKLHISMLITTARRGDLDVQLCAPGGRTRWITQRSGSLSANLELKGADFSNQFAGVPANGTWKLRVRDATPGHLAVFENATLRVGGF